jgi:hypothetical protein
VTAAAKPQPNRFSTNRRGKEFDEAAVGALAHDATIAGSASSPARTNAGGAYYFVGQHDPVMASTSTKRLPAA